MKEIKKITTDKNGAELLAKDTVLHLDGSYYKVGANNGDSLVCYSIPGDFLFIMKPKNLVKIDSVLEKTIAKFNNRTLFPEAHVKAKNYLDNCIKYDNG